MDTTGFNRHRFVFSEEDARALPWNQPYLAYVCYSDWTDGFHRMMHMHKDTGEILLILKGHSRYAVGLHRYQVSRGDVILCSPGMLHDERPETDELYQTLCIGVKKLPDAEQPPYQLLSPSCCPVFHQPEQFGDLVQLFHMIDRHAAERRPHYLPLCQQLTLAALELVRRMIAEREAPALQTDASACAQIERYIETHYAEKLSLEQLGSRFFISPYHLAHIFKQHTGYSLKQYVLRRRVGEAQTRLLDTKDPVSHIAADVGFEDANYFSRLFTKYVGLSPVEYRNSRTET